jgi:hypothetical protein
MKDIRPTEKALLAIADLCPIISATWIDRIGENKDSTNFHFPPVEEHQPPLNAVCESVAEKPNFLPMPRRKNIFRDTTIYVFSEDQVSAISLFICHAMDHHSLSISALSYTSFDFKMWWRRCKMQFRCITLGLARIHPATYCQRCEFNHIIPPKQPR